MSQARIALIIDNVNMGLGHDGLTAIARKLKVNPEKLEPGTVLVFINRAKDKVKLMGYRGIVLGYLRMPRGRRIMMEAIQYIPQAFSASGGINYDDACKQALTKILGVAQKRASPIEAYRTRKEFGLK